MTARQRKTFTITAGQDPSQVGSALVAGQQQLASEREAGRGGLVLAAVPAPYLSEDTGPLTEDQREELRTCESGVAGLRAAFWIAGKALHTIRDARLYRETHPTFEDYLAQRWDMGRAQGYRLIEEWRLGERLSVSPMGDTERVSERQVRALLPVARRSGTEAAADVYAATARAVTGRLTAAVLDIVVAALPPGADLPQDWEQRVAAALAPPEQPSDAETGAGSEAAPQDAPASPLAPLEAALAALRRAYKGLPPAAVDAAVAADPGGAADLLESIRQEAERITRRAVPRHAKGRRAQ